MNLEVRDAVSQRTIQGHILSDYLHHRAGCVGPAIHDNALFFMLHLPYSYSGCMAIELHRINAQLNNSIPSQPHNR